MPNLCLYEMNVQGRKKDIQKLFDWMNAQYNYKGTKSEVYLEKDGKKIPVEHHIGYRVFDCYYDEDFMNETNDEDVIIASANGDVAWSLHSCVTDEPCSYYYDYNKLFSRSMRHDNIFKKVLSLIQRRKSIPLWKACKLLHLKCEIFSEETGLEFSEHICIDEYGRVITNDETSYQTIEIEEYETYEEFVKDNDHLSESITKEVFNKNKSRGNDYIDLCDWLDSDGYFKYQFVHY